VTTLSRPLDRRDLPGQAAGWRERARHHPRALFVAAVLVLLAVAVVATGLGSVSVPAGETLGIIVHRVTGLDFGGAWTPATEAIIWELRLPRVLTAIVVGVGLSVAGVTFQGLLRNPLADPYVLGTASGAALGAAIAVLIPTRLVIVEFGLRNGLAFIGALGAIVLVYRLSRLAPWGGMTNLLLTGYAVGSLLAAGLAMAMYVSGSALRQIFSFLLGGLEASSWLRLVAAFPLIGLGSIGVFALARTLNGLLLGEEAAGHLGVDVPRQRLILLALGSLVTAAAVAVSGLIGFVGLVVPHVVRLVVGPNARIVLPISAVVGATLLTVADLGSRLLGEIPVGVVTSLIGAPFFLALLRQANRGYEL